MKMKRLFTLVLSLMMILSLSAPASAIDGENVYTKEEISSINEVTMWEKAGTNSSGNTSNGNEAPAAKAFMEDLGYSCSYDSYLFDNYSDFTRDLGNNKPCIFTYGAKFGAKSGGHAVLAVGYVETTKYQYLRIADGWNDYLRYINFNGYDYTRKDGWSFSVSK